MTIRGFLVRGFDALDALVGRQPLAAAEVEAWGWEVSEFRRKVARWISAQPEAERIETAARLVKAELRAAELEASLEGLQAEAEGNRSARRLAVQSLMQARLELAEVSDRCALLEATRDRVAEAMQRSGVRS